MLMCLCSVFISSTSSVHWLSICCLFTACIPFSFQLVFRFVSGFLIRSNVLIFFFRSILLQLGWCAGLHFFLLDRVLIVVGIAWRNHIAVFFCDAYLCLCLVVCDHRVRLIIGINTDSTLYIGKNPFAPIPPNPVEHSFLSSPVLRLTGYTW